MRQVVHPEELPFQLSFALTDVEELDVPDDPCIDDPHYNYRECIKDSFATKGRAQIIKMEISDGFFH